MSEENKETNLENKDTGKPAEAPKAEAPKVEAPKPAAPKEEAPKVEAPKPAAPEQEAPKAEATKADAPKPEEKKKGKPSNCAVCNKSIRKKRYYYRNGKYFCTQRCFKTTIKDLPAETGTK